MAVEWFIYLGKAAIYAFFTLLAVAWLIWLLVNAKRSLVDSWDSGSFLFTVFVHAMVGLIAGTLAFQSGRTFITHLEKNYPPTATPASSTLPEASLMPPGTTPYTFTSTHTIVEGRTNCKWEITHAVNGQPNVANASTVYLTPGEEVYLRTFVNETSGTKAVGGDYCKMDSVPDQTFSVRRTVDANNGDGTVAKWEIVYTFTPDDSKPTATPTSKPRPTSTPTSGPWGEDETTDETIGSSSRTVYWVPDGKSYHFNRSCPSLSRSDEIERGTLQEARAAGKKDPCNNCAK